MTNDELAEKELAYVELEYPGWRKYKDRMIKVLEKSTKSISIQEAYHIARERWWEL